MSYLTPDRTKPITARKLGDDFDRAAVLEALTINARNAARAAETPTPKQEYPRSIKDRLQRNEATINAPKQYSVQHMVDIAAKKAEGKGRGYGNVKIGLNQKDPFSKGYWFSPIIIFKA